MVAHLSVIVCTYNRCDLLTGCLQSLGDQRLSPARFEVVVVDNNSTDDTAAVVEHHQARLANLRYVFEPIQGLSHARNRGAAAAVGTLAVADALALRLAAIEALPPDELIRLLADRRL